LVVIAVEGHIDGSHRLLQPERPVQALGQPHATGVDSDQRGVRADLRAHLPGKLVEQGFGVRYSH
jgi:hypothetical protein